MRCDVGGTVVRFHNKLRDWLAEWTARYTGAPTQTEQVVDAWTRFEAPSAEHPEGPVREVARLDGAAFVGGRRTFIDVGFRTAATDDEEEQGRRAREDGRAAQAYVDAKRRRYPPGDNPGEALVPFVVEALGRPSPEAAAFLRAVAPPEAGAHSRASVLGAAWQSVSIITQMRLAELLISAEDPRPPA